MAIGIGGEVVWISPTLSSTNGVNDLSGNGNNGTLVDATIVSDTGSDGTHALEISGETNRVEIGRPAEVVASPNNFSLSVWVYADTLGTGATSHTIWGGYYGLGVNELWSMLRVDSGSLKYWYSNSSGGYTSRTGPSLSTGAWTHVAITIDSSNSIKFYVNGTLSLTQTLVTPSSSPSSNVQWWIGQTQAGLSAASHDEAWDGRIDDFRWIDRVLVQSEITHLATSRGIEGNPYDYNGLGDEKLWLCPSLDDSSDDISGNGNHGTYNGGMSTVADTSNGGTRAYFFDGTDDYISGFPTAITNFVGDPAGTSVSCWIKKAGIGTDPIFIATLGGSGNGWYGKILVTLSGAKKELHIRAASADDYIDSQDSDDTDWHHYAISFDASRNATFYYDGVSKGTASVALPGTSGIALEIGGRAGGLNLVSMYVDDYRIFDGELTLSEAQALASKRGYEVPQGTGPFPHPLTISIKHPLG